MILLRAIFRKTRTANLNSPVILLPIFSLTKKPPLFAVLDILSSQLRPKAKRGRYKYIKARWSALRKPAHKLTQICACDDPAPDPLALLWIFSV